MENLIDIIQKNSLTVRCLPHIVVSYLTYRDGDEKKKYVNSNGKPINDKRTVIIQNYDLEHFKKSKTSKYETRTPEKRYEQWKKNFPNGRKLLKIEKNVKKGGWWYVKETKNTSSTVTFSRKYDKFFAPTLKEAIQLYLDSKK